jgi:hypothetical protein
MRGFARGSARTVRARPPRPLTARPPSGFSLASAVNLFTRRHLFSSGAAFSHERPDFPFLSLQMMRRGGLSRASP